MPRPRLPNLHRERKRGRVVWYVRKGKGPRYRLRAEYGSDAFKAEYDDALAGRKVRRGQAVAGTLQWLWDASKRWRGSCAPKSATGSSGASKANCIRASRTSSPRHTIQSSSARARLRRP